MIAIRELLRLFGLKEVPWLDVSRGGLCDGVNFTYDTLNRVVEALNPLPSNPHESYVYDPVGNRTNSKQIGSSIFTSANQLTEDANFTYQHDNIGNMTRKTAKVAIARTAAGSYAYQGFRLCLRLCFR